MLTYALDRRLSQVEAVIDQKLQAAIAELKTDFNSRLHDIVSFLVSLVADTDHMSADVSRLIKSVDNPFSNCDIDIKSKAAQSENTPDATTMPVSVSHLRLAEIQADLEARVQALESVLTYELTRLSNQGNAQTDFDSLAGSGAASSPPNDTKKDQLQPGSRGSIDSDRVQVMQTGSHRTQPCRLSGQH